MSSTTIWGIDMVRRTYLYDTEWVGDSVTLYLVQDNASMSLEIDVEEFLLIADEVRKEYTAIQKKRRDAEGE